MHHPYIGFGFGGRVHRDAESAPLSRLSVAPQMSLLLLFLTDTAVENTGRPSSQSNFREE